ncbi:MAG: NAD(P)H-dependent glycerol-3-phosphate dehydrogenase, partial [Myxococcota bacterium]
VAAEDEALAKKAQTLMSCSWMRTYITHDVVGVEMGGALKNVIAIACGIADGLGLGHNTRAALITRGLAELTRAAVRQGADPLTLAGLAGMGDLVLTCTGDQSRNRRVGIGLGKGRSLQEILDEMGQVAEGVKTTLSAQQLAEKLGVDMPITHEMHRILYQQEPAQAAVKRLMMRTLKHEAQ